MDLQKFFRHLGYKIKYEFLQEEKLPLYFLMAIILMVFWASISKMQVNYEQQKNYESKVRQQKLSELEVATLKYQKNYYKSDEYKELLVREKTGKGFPGEKMLILPENSNRAKTADVKTNSKNTVENEEKSNFSLWMEFLLGGKAASSNEK